MEILPIPNTQAMLLGKYFLLLFSSKMMLREGVGLLLG